jgi:glutaminyl-peptide cyclotransferase
MRIVLILFGICVLLACDKPKEKTNVTTMNVNSSKVSSSDSKLPIYTYQIVNTFKHDSKAFTQGLVFHKGFLYESTGENGSSSIRKVELETGKVLQKTDLEKKYFGEGMTILDGKAYQITWRDKTGFVYDLETLSVEKQVKYLGEGWGLTNNGKNLIMSDGTHVLKLIDPETFDVVKSIPVLRDNGTPLYLLNELEFVKDEIWANIWHSEETETGTTQGLLPNVGKPNLIARINAESGKVLGWIDLSGISPEDNADDSENTLNGIAYDAENDRIFVTGKRWKKLFEIRLLPKQ